MARKRRKNAQLTKKEKERVKNPKLPPARPPARNIKKNKPSAKKLKEKLGPARSLFLQPAAVQVVRVLARALARALTKPFTLKRNTCRKTSGRP